MNEPTTYPPASSLPPAGQAVLLLVTEKSQVRAVLRRVLADWTGLPPQKLPLRETSRGPRWIGPLAGDFLDISISYCGQEAWLGLLRGGSIGIDAMPLEPIPEAAEVASHYFSPKVRAALQQSPDPIRAFAIAWTELEARLKCLKRDLTEWSPAREDLTAPCVIQNFVSSDATVITAALIPFPPAVGLTSHPPGVGPKGCYRCYIVDSQAFKVLQLVLQ
jgi:hypothetical protein